MGQAVRLQQNLPEGSYILEVIDAVKDRKALAEYDVIMVPALTRVEPKPELRLIAELTDAKKIALALGFPALEPSEQRPRFLPTPLAES